MSILIKGMEMPKNEPLLVKINPDGSVSTTAKNGYKKYEAVRIPPHGRLGDLDALEEKAIERSRCGVSVNVLEKVITAYDIETAPTVIPAEERTDSDDN